MGRWFKPSLTRAITVFAALAVAVPALTLSGSAASAGSNVSAYSPMLCAWLDANKNNLPSPVKTCPNGMPARGSIDQVATKGSGRLFPAADKGHPSPALRFSPNVDATDPTEDTFQGQSETAIAASGNFVLSAWNDASGFFTDPLSTQGLTGVGFSNDAGQTFTDLIGLPNTNPNQRWFGDPTVVSFKASDGTVYFYIGSLYLPGFFFSAGGGGGGGGGTGCSNFEVALQVAKVPAGSNQLVFIGGAVPVVNGGSFFCNGTFTLPNFPDKPFATIDRNHGKIAVSYTCFGFGSFTGSPSCGFNGEIDLAACDISVDPTTPTCSPGSNPGATFIQVAPPDPNFEVLQGSYPTVNPSSGDVYVAWERNWLTNVFFCFFGGPGCDRFTHIQAAHVPSSCITGSGGCASLTSTTIEQNLRSLDGFGGIPGYNRFFGQDFPRIAFNSVTGQVVIVWNEANKHWLGDIVMKTTDASLGNLSDKLIVNDDNSGALHFLPAVSVDAFGNINISWYDRRTDPTGWNTNVFAASIRPGSVGGVNAQVTTVATNWAATPTLIAPNFGDYTDNTSDGGTFFVNWSDGRAGAPNSFVASAPTLR